MSHLTAVTAAGIPTNRSGGIGSRTGLMSVNATCPWTKRQTTHPFAPLVLWCMSAWCNGALAARNASASKTRTMHTAITGRSAQISFLACPCTSQNIVGQCFSCKLCARRVEPVVFHRFHLPVGLA